MFFDLTEGSAVVEMRSFMMDIDGREARGRLSAASLRIGIGMASWAAHRRT